MIKYTTYRLLSICIILIIPYFIVGRPNIDSLKGKEISFIENKGQWDNRALYRVELDGAHIYLERNALTFDHRDQEAFSKFVGYKLLSQETKAHTPVPSGDITHFAYSVRFKGARDDVQVTGSEGMRGIYNYFLGNDPSKWASKVRRYGRVKYSGLYDGIDLHLMRDEVLFKYEFHCSPGSSPADIVMFYDGVKEMSLKYGNLMIRTPFSVVYELKPYAYQTINGKKREVSCKFKLTGNELSYVIGKYDPSYELIIDPPVRVFGSYTGSTSDNWGYTATYDDLGNLYAGGNAFANGYPTTTGAYQVSYAGHSCDIAISKFHHTGAYLEYSTYLGGSGTEVPHSLVVNQQGQLYILGSSGSANYPTTSGAFDETFNGGMPYTLTHILNYSNGSDIVISKLSDDGTQLLASTFVGGTDNDGLNTAAILKHNYADEVRGEIIVDDAGNIMVVSSTHSADFPVTSNAYQTVKNSAQDAVIFKMDNQLSSMIWSTFLGGSDHDAGYSITHNPKGGTYIAGGTRSNDFPVTNGALYTTFQGGSCDGWVARINPLNSQILNSTYFGSGDYDQVYFTDYDRQGNVYLFGQTKEKGNYFVNNVAWYQPSGGQFISKLDPALSQIHWSTAFGSGNGIDISPTAFMIDLCNRIYVSGWGGTVNGFGGTAGLPVTPDAFQSSTDNSDYYFMVLKEDAAGLEYATYYGGPQSYEHVDGGTSRFDRKGRIYQAVCAGCGGHSDFPTSPGAWSNQNKNSNCNVGVVVFDFETPALVADFLDPPSICAPDVITFINTSQVYDPASTTYFWDFGNGITSNLPSPSITFTASGVFNVTLIITDSGTCNYADTIMKQVVVLSGQSLNLNSKNICLGDQIQIGLLPINDPSVTYQWLPPSFLNNSSISNPIASPPVTQNYMLYVTNGICADTFHQQVVVHDLVVDAGPDVGICKSTVQLTATTNNTGVKFQWSDNPGFTNTLNSPSSNPLCVVSITTPQYFYVKMYNDWCDAYDSVFVDQLVKFASVNVQHPNCHGDCDGEVMVTLSGGTSPYKYSWSNSTATGATATGLCAGVHTVTVTDANECIGVSQFTLIDPPLLELETSAINAPCADVCIGRGYATSTGGAPPYSYQWNDPNNQTGNPATNLCPGNYSVTVTDSKGCEVNAAIVIEDSSIYVNFSASANRDTIFEGQSVQLQSTWLGSGSSYSWSPPKWLSNPSVQNPLANPYGNVTYTVIGKDKYGCVYMDTVVIGVLEVICDDPYIFVPNAFTPNGDGKNDVLYIYTIYADDIYFAIFNRWGEKVFETRNKEVGWDGTFKGRDVDPGVFDYYLEVRCFNQVLFKKKGNITLIR